MEQSIAKKEKHVKFNLTVEEKTIIKDKNKALDIYEPQNQKIKQKNKNKHKLNKKKQSKFIEEKKQKNILEKPFNNKIKNKNNNQHKLKESKRNFDIKIDTKNLTDIEKTIIKDGTFIDKLNLVTLLILKNNDNDLLTILLDKIPSFRNDDKFYALKNVKDLLKEEFALTTVNKLKFKRIFESETKNNFIKEKMLNLLKELIKKQILINDLLYILVNKLGDKKKIHKNIFSFLEEIYNENKKIVIKELILFYDKCSILRGKINVAKFFALHCKNEDLTNFYSSFDDLEYKKETEVVQLYYYFLLGMKERVLSISYRKLKCCLKNEKLVLLSLYAIKNNFKEKLNSVLLTVINFNYKVNGYDLLNFIYESVEEKKEIIDALFKSANIIDIKFLCGVIMLAKASNEKIGKISDLLKVHYHPLVRSISCEKNTELIDPYNEIEFKKKVYDSFKYL